MIRKLIFVLLFSISMQAIAQDKKWSVEANYPISVGDEIGNDPDGIIDVGIKYRFLDFNIVKLGVGVNAGFSKKNISYNTSTQFDFDETNLIIQPKVFAEFTIPAIKKLHPSIGLGYSIVKYKQDGIFSGTNDTYKDSNGGINLNLGLSYDISSKFFVQVQYDYIGGEFTQVNMKQDVGLLKLGVGFRF